MYKNLLVVTPTPSHPQDSGNRKRIYSLFKHLQSNSFKIHYVLYNIYNSDFICNRSSYEAMKAEWDYFDVVMPSPDRHKVFTKFRNRLLNSRYYHKLASKGIRLPIQYQIDDWCCDALTNFISWKCRNFPVSTAFIEYVFLSKVAEFIPKNTWKVIDTHDVFADRHITMIKNDIEPSFFTTSSREEVKGLNRSDLVLAIQEEEKKYFEARINPEVMEVSHLEEEKFINKEYKALTSIGIISSLNAINIRSVQLFLDLVHKTKSLSSIKIFIAGGICKRISCSSPNVVILGQVECLEDFYNLADLYINPMVAGTGIKIKTIEAFSYGVPLLSTKFGTTGTESNFDFHNFSNLEELVQHLDNLYSSQASLEAYQEASKSCFHNYREKLDSQLNSLLERLDNKQFDHDSSPELTGCSTTATKQ